LKANEAGTIGAGSATAIAGQSSLMEISPSSRCKIIVYFALLNLAMGLGSPLIGLAAIPIYYYLKDKLTLSPVELAMFVSIAGAPT
jgi:hypothetical protein